MMLDVYVVWLQRLEKNHVNVKEELEQDLFSKVRSHRAFELIVISLYIC